VVSGQLPVVSSLTGREFFQAEGGDFGLFGGGELEFGGAGVGESLLEGGEHFVGGFAGGADDEDEAEFLFIGDVAGGEGLNGGFIGGLDGGLFAGGPGCGGCELFAEAVDVSDFGVVREGFEKVGFGEGLPDAVGGGEQVFHGFVGAGGEHFFDPAGGAVAAGEVDAGEGFGEGVEAFDGGHLYSGRWNIYHGDTEARRNLF